MCRSPALGKSEPLAGDAALQVALTRHDQIVGESQDENDRISRRHWTWNERRAGWWYLLPLAGWTGVLAVTEHGVSRIISAILAVSGVFVVLTDLYTKDSDDRDEEPMPPESLTEAEVRRRYSGAM